VTFAYTPTRFGGQRQWFRCLKCHRRCRKIYGGRYSGAGVAIICDTRRRAKTWRSAHYGVLTRPVPPGHQRPAELSLDHSPGVRRGQSRKPRSMALGSSSGSQHQSNCCIAKQ
jgi:hypothetical protein